MGVLTGAWEDMEGKEEVCIFGGSVRGLSSWHVRCGLMVQSGSVVVS